MKVAILAIALLSLVSVCSAGHWAVLVAGSNGFWNYRHHADTCHAYITLLNKGFHPENIIVFAFDDVAADPSNPFPGKLFNKPTYTQEGKDVYGYCKIDYKGNDVNSANFLKVIKGDAAGMKGVGTGRVLQSTSTDRVFLNFADHGATGLIAFPNDYLYANDLLAALTYMNQQKMYSELVFYLEACESGSMFQTLPTNTKVFATSAANPDESSWGTYCSPDDVVNGTSVGSCLGDLYSVNWMEDTDVENICTESLQQQFLVVQKLTNLSHVMEWGDQSFSSEAAGDFTGNCVARSIADISKAKAKEEKRSYTSVDSRDIKLFYLQNKYNKNPTHENLVELQKEEISRKFFDVKFYQVAKTNGFGFLYDNKVLFNAPRVNNFNCLKAAVAKFEQHCGKLSDYALKHVKTLAHMCAYQNEASNGVMIESIQTVCEAYTF
jgi:legumain